MVSFGPTAARQIQRYSKVKHSELEGAAQEYIRAAVMKQIAEDVRAENAQDIVQAAIGRDN